MRFTVKVSLIAMLAIAAVYAEPAAEKNRRRSGRSNDLSDDSDSISFDLENSYSDDFERRRHRRHRNGCDKCGRNPCGCKGRKEEPKREKKSNNESMSTYEISEEENGGRLIITAPVNCSEEFYICSSQVITWSAPKLVAEGFTHVLGYYVGGVGCNPSEEAKKFFKELMRESSGQLATRTIFYLGGASITTEYLQWNIPYYIPNGKYQPVLVAFKVEDHKIRMVPVAGAWIKAAHGVEDKNVIYTDLQLVQKFK